MRYRIDISYDGTSFCGWQIQPGAPSVQEALEKALGVLLHGSVKVTGCGRTDTGVSATHYTAHFDSESVLEDCNNLVFKLNAILPPSVAVRSLEAVGDDFHARFGAVRREYVYHIHFGKDPFADAFSYRIPYPSLDFEAMNRAAALLPGTRNFSCFEKTGGAPNTGICTIFEAGWHRCEPTPSVGGEHWYFRIAADRFLRNMVRAIVGTMIEVGRARRSPESVAQLLESGDRRLAGESVPGKALFLDKVEY